MQPSVRAQRLTVKTSFLHVQEKLGAEERLHADLSVGEGKLGELEGQIRQARERCVGLKAQVLRNNVAAAKLLGMVVSGGS